MKLQLSNLSLLGLVIVYLISGLEAKVCGKYHKNGACSLIQTATETITPAPVPSMLVVLCLIACDEGRDSVFSVYCKCLRKNGPSMLIFTTPTTASSTATPTTASIIATSSTTNSTKIQMTASTIPSTTTELTTTTVETTTTEETTTTSPLETTTISVPLETCYYTRNRPAKAVSSRMYSGSVSVDCNYPGVVGIYNATSLRLLCMGVLLEESTIMIDTFCKTLVSAYSTLSYASMESYTKPTNFTSLPTIVASSAKLLDPTSLYSSTDHVNTKVYTVSLNKPVVFNSACIQPACFPNKNIPLTDIDLNDCRITGYGDTNDTIGSSSSVLNEVQVRVDATSVASGILKYTRVDGKSSKTGPCFNDQGAPLICNHYITGEWITIGVVTGAGLKCSLGTAAAAAVTSLLKETTYHTLFDALQSFKYVAL